MYNLSVFVHLFLYRINPVLENVPVFVLECDEEFERDRPRQELMVKQVGVLANIHLLSPVLILLSSVCLFFSNFYITLFFHVS